MYLEGNKYACFAQRLQLEYEEEGESGEKKIYLLVFGRGRNQSLQVHLCPRAHEQLCGVWGFVFKLVGFQISRIIGNRTSSEETYITQYGSWKVSTSQ